MKTIFWAVSCSCIGVLSAMQQGSVIPSNKPSGEPYLGNYIIEDSCQYKICGTEYLDEFGGQQPSMSSCSGECDALAHKLVNSKFKKEFLWSKCSNMCAEKYPVKEYKTYNERISCMNECFEAFEYVAPHHRIAQACVHAACSNRIRDQTGQTAMECFSQCTHHVATRVPKDDWNTWSNLLSVANCDPIGLPGNQMDRLSCTDQTLWKDMTSRTSVSPDIHLVCLNAMCDNNVRCAKDCLHHVTQEVSQEDLPRWHQCTYSTTCTEIHSYELRKECADNCLEAHKIEFRKSQELKMREAENRKRKDAEALLSGTNSILFSSSVMCMVVSLVVLVIHL